MMYRHNDMAVNLKDVRTMQIIESVSKKNPMCWSISIIYYDNNVVFIKDLLREEANQLLNSMIKVINGGK